MEAQVEANVEADVETDVEADVEANVEGRGQATLGKRGRRRSMHSLQAY